jgi:hypothetical protein
MSELGQSRFSVMFAFRAKANIEIPQHRICDAVDSARYSITFLREGKLKENSTDIRWTVGSAAWPHEQTI